MNTSLFILLREYTDGVIMPSSPYINAEDCLDEGEWLILYKRLINTIDFFRYEICDRFFDIENLAHATYPFDLLKDYYEERDIYPCTSENILTQISSMGFIDWREEYDENDEYVQMYIYNGVDVTNDTLGEILRVKKSYPAILLNCEALRCPSQINVSSNDGQTYYIDCVDDIHTLHNWFSNNRQPRRVFVYNPKHGDKFHPSEYISGTDRKAARLEATCEEAQRLLDLAISTSPTDAFWYYDAQVGKYIYFENQQEIRLAFHGYHLSPGEENYDNIGKEKLAKIL